MRISQTAFDFIVEQETGGQKVYERTEQATDWPGGPSGVTIGIGYDCGYCSATQIGSDWGGKLPSSMITSLQTTAGIVGDPAQSAAQRIKSSVSVPWTVAIDVFRSVDIPRWEAIVYHALPNADALAPDSYGALVSLAFNRGASFDKSGDRYTEMRNIKQHMADKRFDLIPAEFRSMKRVWIGTSLEHDMTQRREAEAVLFEQGLKEHVGAIGTGQKPMTQTQKDAIDARKTPPPAATPQRPDHEDGIPLWKRLFTFLDSPIGGKR
jgi:hypothetical protein